MRKALIIIGVLAVIAVACVLLVLNQRGVAFSPAQVEAAAEAMLPGVKPVEGLHGVARFEADDVEVAIFAAGLPQVDPGALDKEQLRVVLARPSGDEQPVPEQIRARLEEMQDKKAEKLETVGSRAIMLKLGGHPHPAKSDTLVLKSSGQRLREDMTVVKAGGRAVVILITGPEETFNEGLRDRFLTGCQADPMAGEPTPPAPPMTPTEPTPPPLPRLPGPGRRPPR
ncbi:MAG: hypothetical protein KC910_06610 [Candidatus Eremiobacteraeota bacterium]|nr:hypothetical protein [Candidatus Eremiobacteraeota bacterium]